MVTDKQRNIKNMEAGIAAVKLDGLYFLSSGTALIGPFKDKAAANLWRGCGSSWKLRKVTSPKDYCPPGFHINW